MKMLERRRKNKCKNADSANELKFNALICWIYFFVSFLLLFFAFDAIYIVRLPLVTGFVFNIRDVSSAVHMTAFRFCYFLRYF